MLNEKSIGIKFIDQIKPVKLPRLQIDSFIHESKQSKEHACVVNPGILFCTIMKKNPKQSILQIKLD